MDISNIKKHIGKNWKKYAVGSAIAAGAAGIGLSLPKLKEMHDDYERGKSIGDIERNVTDSVGKVGNAVSKYKDPEKLGEQIKNTEDSLKDVFHKIKKGYDKKG